MPSQKPIKIHIPAALRHHQIKLKTFLKRNEQYTNLAVGSFIFYPSRAHLIPPPPFGFVTNKGIASNSASNHPIEPARLLLVQRAHTERSFPDLWEVPGGGSEHSDPTILHSVARETFEETGLHLQRLLRQIGQGEEFETKQGPCLKLNFEIEVTELADVGKIAKCATLGDLQIELDPAEHQEFVWATEEDIREEIYPAATPEAKAAMLHAFRLRREEEEKIRAQAVKASKAHYENHYGTESGADDDDDNDEDDDGEEDEEMNEDEDKR